MSEWKKQPTEKLDDDLLEQVSGGMDELPADRLGGERQRLRDRSASDRIGGLSKSVVVQMSEKLTNEGGVVMNEKNYEMNEAQLDQVAGGVLVGSESSELWKCTCRACGKMTIVSQRPTTCRLCGSTNISVAKNSY